MPKRAIFSSLFIRIGAMKQIDVSTLSFSSKDHLSTSFSWLTVS